MPARRLARLAAVPLALAAAGIVAVPARGDKPVLPPPPSVLPAAPAVESAGPWFVADDELLDTLTGKLGELAGDGKCLAPDKLKEKVAADRAGRVAPAKPGDKRLDPEDVYATALPSVFIVGSVVEADDEFKDGRMATAWVLAADGVLVTNWHVFDKVEGGEYFGAMDRRGNVYPLTDVLAVNKTADIAVFKVAAAGLTPLPVADRPAAVGAWVGVLGHPGDRYFSFTQGAVSRYSTVKRDDGPAERWMSITADYAYGASGSPVLNKYGAVVGMAALTENLDYPEDEPKPDDKPKADDPGKKDPPARRESLLQMVVKLTTPAADIRKAAGAE